MLILAASIKVTAQRQNRIGYIDMDYILENLADYHEANQELDHKINEWKKEIDFRRQKIQDMKRELENERPLLTQDLIDERQDEIDYEQHSLIAYQQKRFGPEGDMMERRKQIIQPIQDQVFNAIQEIGERREYDFIFDSSDDALMLFSAKRHDISNQVLALIDRKSAQAIRERDRDERNDPTIDDEEDVTRYKSVTQAREDREKREDREAERLQKDEERKSRLNERQRVRDSIRGEREKEYEARRMQIKEDREAKRNPVADEKEEETTSKKDLEKEKRHAEEVENKRIQDSVQQAEREQAQKDREQMILERQERAKARRDSLDTLRQLRLEERRKTQDSIREARQKMREKD